jgi:hypothetical protein
MIIGAHQVTLYTHTHRQAGRQAGWIYFYVRLYIEMHVRSKVNLSSFSFFCVISLGRKKMKRERKKKKKKKRLNDWL